MPVLGFALALAIAISMITLSGFGAEIGQDPNTDIDEQFEESASESEEVDFDPDEGGDSLLGSTVAAMRTVETVLGVVVYLPSTIESLGAPGWFATLFGRGTQIVMALGIAQIIRGFEIR